MLPQQTANSNQCEPVHKIRLPSLPKAGIETKPPTSLSDFVPSHHTAVCPTLRVKGSSFLARLPRQVDLLRERDRGVVVGDLAGSGAVGGGQGDAVVDVEDAVGAAGAKDVAGGGDLVLLGVDGAAEPLAAALDARLRRRRRRRVLAEVVRRVERPRHAPVQLRVPVVRAVHHRELEPPRVLEVQVQLAVLGLGRRVVARSDVGLELVEAEGDYLWEERGRLASAMYA